MAKVAKLVTLVVMTRVVVDDNENAADKAAELAVNKIRNDYANYIIQDNVDEIEDDIECPYGSLPTDCTCTNLIDGKRYVMGYSQAENANMVVYADSYEEAEELFENGVYVLE